MKSKFDRLVIEALAQYQKLETKMLISSLTTGEDKQSVRLELLTYLARRRLIRRQALVLKYRIDEDFKLVMNLWNNVLQIGEGSNIFEVISERLVLVLPQKSISCGMSF